MFAQESVMDLQKEREAFEAATNIYHCIYNADLNYYFSGSKFVGDKAETQVNAGWKAWQAAKAQAVPDVQQALNDRLLVRSIKEQVESHIAEISVNDLFDKGWLAAMKCIQNNIDMLEAQEPAND